VTDDRLELGDTPLHEGRLSGVKTSFPAPLAEQYADCDRLRWEVNPETQEIIVTPYRDEEGEPE
jgi:hypothetical protein